MSTTSSPARRKTILLMFYIYFNFVCSSSILLPWKIFSFKNNKTPKPKATKPQHPGEKPHTLIAGSRAVAASTVGVIATVTAAGAETEARKGGPTMNAKTKPKSETLTAKILFNLAPAMKDLLAECAYQDRQSMGQFIRAAIAEKIQRGKKP